MAGPGGQLARPTNSTARPWVSRLPGPRPAHHSPAACRDLLAACNSQSRGSRPDRPGRPRLWTLLNSGKEARPTEEDIAPAGEEGEGGARGGGEIEESGVEEDVAQLRTGLQSLQTILAQVKCLNSGICQYFVYITLQGEQAACCSGQLMTENQQLRARVVWLEQQLEKTNLRLRMMQKLVLETHL